MSEVSHSRGNTENPGGEGEDGQDHPVMETVSCEQMHEVKQSEGNTKVTVLVREPTIAAGEGHTDEDNDTEDLGDAHVAKSNVETGTSVDECQKKWSHEEFIPTNEDVESAKSLGKAENILYIYLTSFLLRILSISRDIEISTDCGRRLQ